MKNALSTLFTNDKQSHAIINHTLGYQTYARYWTYDHAKKIPRGPYKGFTSLFDIMVKACVSHSHLFCLRGA